MPLRSLEWGTCAPQLYRMMRVSPRDAKLIVSSVNPKCLEYNFNIPNCTGGEKAPRICSVCRREGHLKDNCPEERLPPLEPLPERTPEAMSVLDHLCQHIFDVNVGGFSLDNGPDVAIDSPEPLYLDYDSDIIPATP
ncbi:Terminal uridylyltransferase 4 [Homalodisca vitripennis]|nr:Terminal uridylyltransferase 4 [Homalodisca vitripennis]